MKCGGGRACCHFPVTVHNLDLQALKTDKIVYSISSYGRVSSERHPNLTRNRHFVPFSIFSIKEKQRI